MLADQDMQAIGLRTYLIGAKGLAPVWTTVHWQMKGRGFSYTSPLLLCLLDPLGFREAIVPETRIPIRSTLGRRVLQSCRASSDYSLVGLEYRGLGTPAILLDLWPPDLQRLWKGL